MGLFSFARAFGLAPVTWYPLNSPTTNKLTAVVSTGSQWIAVGQNSTVLGSPDGFRWRQAYVNSPGDLLAATYGNGLFVAGGTESNLLVLSPDGTNWSVAVSGTGAESIRGLAFGGGRFVGVGAISGHAYITTSIDGTNWSIPVIPQVSSLNAVAYNNGYHGPALFAAVGEAGVLMTSSNGMDWTLRPSATANTLRAITLGANGSAFVAGGDFGNVVTSGDGLSWVAGAPTSFDVNGLGSTYDAVVAAGHYFSEGRIQSSSSGQTWPGMAQSTSRPLNAVASAPYFGGPFVAVGDNGVIFNSSPNPGPVPNSWTKSTSGAWEEPYWSLQELPASWNAQVLFTNAGSKALSISVNTVATYSNSLQIRELV